MTRRECSPVGKAGVHETSLDVPDPAVHHVARRDDVRSSPGIVHSDLRNAAILYSSDQTGVSEMVDGKWTHRLQLFSASMRPSSVRIPQWPCEVYSHRQTSTAMRTEGKSSRIFLMARMTGVSGEDALDPSGSWHQESFVRDGREMGDETLAPWAGTWARRRGSRTSGPWRQEVQGTGANEISFRQDTERESSGTDALELADTPTLLTGQRRDGRLLHLVVGDEDRVHEHLLCEPARLALPRARERVVVPSLEDGADRREERAASAVARRDRRRSTDEMSMTEEEVILVQRVEVASQRLAPALVRFDISPLRPRPPRSLDLLTTVMAAQLDALLATGVALDSPDFAARLDALSPVGATRELYELPTRRNIGTVGDDLGQFTCSAAAGGSRALPADAASLPSDGPCVYMAGNSLGLLPKKARTLINQEMDVWGSRSASLS